MFVVVRSVGQEFSTREKDKSREIRGTLSERSHSSTSFAGTRCNSFECRFEIVAIRSCKLSYVEVRSGLRKCCACTKSFDVYQRTANALLVS